MKQLIITAIVAGGIFTSISVADAATFSGNMAGVLGTSSIIDSSGSADYTTLDQAAQDYSNYAGKMVSDYTFYISSDLAEVGPITFDKRITTYTLSLKPLHQSRAISITTDVGFSFYGASNSGIRFGPTGSHKINIDGSSTSSTYGLHFSFEATANHPVRALDLNGIAFVARGNVNISHCSFEKISPSYGDSSVLLISPQASFPYPHTVANCAIICSQEGGSGILVKGLRNGMQSEVEISDNIVSATSCGLRVQNMGGTITQNRININGLAGHENPLSGIALNPGAMTTSQSNVTKNHVNISGGNAAILTQGIRCYGYSDYPGELIIQNNMVSLDLDTGLNSRPVMGVTLVHKRANVAEVTHNSVYLPDNQTTNTDLGQRFHALGIEGVSSNTAIIANNMAKIGTNWAAGLFYHTQTSVVSDGNVIGLTGGAVFATDTLSTFSLLSDWQAASAMDLHSQAFDPESVWVSKADLHVVQPVSGIAPGIANLLMHPPTTDIDGDPRSATVSQGADEMILGAAVTGWKEYN